MLAVTSCSKSDLITFTTQTVKCYVTISARNMLKATLFILASVALSVAEPPVPSSRYLPSSFPSPSSRYGAPLALSSNYGVPNPSSSYGAPSFDQTEAVVIPNMQYGAPRISSQYGAPRIGSTFASSGISSQYGVPGIGSQYSAPQVSSQYGVPNVGNNYLPPSAGYARVAYDEQSEPANYNFQYQVQDGEQGNDFGHEEARHDEQAQGKYSVVLPDGRRQTVEYTADAEGYKPKISYEQTNNGYGYSRGGNGGYSNGGYTNGGYANGGGYSNGAYTNGGGYSNGEISNGRSSNGGYQY